MLAAALGFAVLLVLVFLRLPIAFAMALVGAVGYAILIDWPPAFSLIAQIARDTAESYALSVVPLFILMGNFVSRAGLSEQLYTASNAFLGHRRGGLAMATIVACGGFSAICGSSLATAATMAKVAMPSMRRFGYADSIATGSIAAGGTLGILIPPSVVLVIYGLITQSDVSKLFAAGILPGIVGILFYVGAVQFMIRLNPELGPPGERTAWPARWRALRDVWGVVVLFVVVIGGIYVGAFTPTEAAGIGAFGALLFTLFKRVLDRRMLFRVLAETGVTTSMLFVVLIGALIFANFINETGMPNQLAEFVRSLEIAPLFVIFGIMAIYILLGCVFESLSMLLLTVPVFVPLIVALADGLGMTKPEVLIWFGIVVVVVTEISLITPPVGLNVYVLRGVLPDVSTGTIFAGVTPFWCADILRLTLIVLVPPLSLFVPSLL
ncbi:MAG: TRAP transporter large permease [Rhodospirillaceae bacterium]|nr:TRAP transporter large permease [Rhodospirillaceae bacterium]